MPDQKVKEWSVFKEKHVRDVRSSKQSLHLRPKYLTYQGHNLVIGNLAIFDKILFIP